MVAKKDCAGLRIRPAQNGSDNFVITLSQPWWVAFCHYLLKYKEW